MEKLKNESERSMIDSSRAGQPLIAVHRLDNEAVEVCRRRPWLWNIYGYEKAWRDSPGWVDFADPLSPAHHAKEFQLRVYLDLLSPYFSSLPAGSKILDIGGGTGRFAGRFIERGHFVTLLDASRSNLAAAAAKLGDSPRLDLIWSEADSLDFLPEGCFDLVLGMEILPYVEDPRRTLEGMTRALKAHGPVILGVENRLGSALGDPSLDEAGVREVLEKGMRLEEEEAFVRYFDPGRLEALLEEASLDVELLTGALHVSDGPLNRFFPPPGETPSQGCGEELLRLERFLRADEGARFLGRTIVAVGRRKKRDS